MQRNGKDDHGADGSRLMVLRLLEHEPSMSQRELAQRLGISLGKTHYLLQALLSKGLLKVRNFERSNRKLSYIYLLTPAGMREKAQMTRDFLARKEAEFEEIKGVIAALRLELDNVAAVPAGPSSADEKKGERE